MRNSIQNMQSSFGATDKIPYMQLHEEGGIKRPKHGSRLAIAQIQARGGSKNKVINKSLYIKTIQKRLVSGPMKRQFKSKRAVTVARAAVAFRENKYLIYNRNIYKITSFTKSKNKIHFNKQHLYNLSQRHGRIKAEPWMLPSTEQPLRDGQNIYNSQIHKLLQKELI